VAKSGDSQFSQRTDGEALEEARKKRGRAIKGDLNLTSAAQVTNHVSLESHQIDNNFRGQPNNSPPLSQELAKSKGYHNGAFSDPQSL
jgi:hypothetical protein